MAQRGGILSWIKTLWTDRSSQQSTDFVKTLLCFQLLPTLFRFKWDCVKSIGLFVLGVVVARWVVANKNISIVHFKTFQRHARPECRQSMMEASSQFYSDNKPLSEYQFPGRRLSNFIALKTIVLKVPSLSQTDSFIIFCLLFSYV